MARTQQEIKSSMTTPFIGNATIIELYGLEAGQTFEQQFSLVSLENILFEIVTFAIWTLETLWDIFRTELNAEMALQQPHTKDWYRNKALGFLLGVPVIAETDKFDTTGLDDDAIEAAKIVKQAAAIKLVSTSGYGILRLKVATSYGGALQPLEPEHRTALDYYMQNNVIDAGTQLVVSSNAPDELRYYANIYFDPRILDSFGARLDGTNNTPAQSGAITFLQSIDFNGTLNLKELERAIRNVEGVIEAETTGAASRYGEFTYDTEGTPNVGAITLFRVADSGYFTMEDLQLNFIPFE